MLTEQVFDEVACANCSFYKVCHAASQSPLKSLAKRKLVAKRGDIICRDNQKFFNYYVVCNGILKSYSTKSSSKEYICNFYYPGDIIGIDALYNMKFEYSVASITEASMCIIPYHDTQKLIAHNPDIHNHFINTASKMLNSKHYLIHLNADQRLAGFLLELISRLKLNHKSIDLPMKQIDIANHLNLTPETINRIFHRWQENGIITELHNKHFSIPDLNKLDELWS